MTKKTDSILEKEAKNHLRQTLTAAVKVDKNALELLIDLFEPVSYKKNHIIINAGQMAEYFYFIHKGLIRIYYYKNEKLVIERFEKEGGLFGGNFSHVTKKPGTHIYESVEDVFLLRIKYEDCERLCNQSHEIERLYRINMELFHSDYVNRLTSFKSASSEERYHEFVKEYGDIAKRVSLKDIANYLGMTPETISRIRSR